MGSTIGTHDLISLTLHKCDALPTEQTTTQEQTANDHWVRLAVMKHAEMVMSNYLN